MTLTHPDLLRSALVAWFATAVPLPASVWNDAGATDNWNTTDLNWDAGSAWINGSAADFSGAGETITLTEAGLTAGTVTFGTAGYAINTNGQNTTWSTLAGPAGFTKTGAGTLTLSNASTASGTVNLTGGRITILDNAALGTAAIVFGGGTLERNAGNVTIANDLTIGAGGGTLLGRQVVDAYTRFSGTLGGTGPLVIQGLVELANGSSTYSGAVTVSSASASYLRLGASQAIGSASSLNLAGSNATLRIDGGVTQSVGAFSSSGGGTVFVSNDGGGNPVGTLRFGSDNTSTTYTGGLLNNSGQLHLVKEGTGTFTLGATAGSNFTGFTISAGTVSLTNNNVGGGTYTLGDAGTGTNDVRFTSTGSSVSRNITVANLGTGTATIGSTGGTGNTQFSGVLTLNRATTLTAGSSDRTTYTGRITGNVGTLTFAGGRRTVLESANGLNDFTGDIVLTDPNTVLQIGAGSLTGENIPNGSNVTVGAGTALKLASNAGSTETINALNGTGTVQRHEGVGGLQTLVIGAGNGGGSFGGLFENGAGSLALRKVGTGTQTITRAGQNASGGITINDGTLRLNANAGFDSGVFGGTHAFTINGPGVLEVASAWNIRTGNTFAVNGGTIHFSLGGAEPNANYLNNLTSVNGTISGNAFRTGNNTTTTYNFSGDTGNAITAGMGMVRVGASQTVILNVANGAAAGDLVVSGAIHDVTSFAGSTLQKSGDGTAVFTANNTYTGATIVAAGVLAINGSLAGGGVTVNNGATLRGNGAIAGAVSVSSGGTLAPGNSIESLAVGSLALNNGSIYDYEIDKGDSNLADLVIVNGALNLDGATLGVSSSGTWMLGDKVTLFAYTGTGWGLGFAGFGDDTVHSFGGADWLLDYNDTVEGANFAGETGAGFSYVTLTVVPEPSAVASLAIGGLVVVLRRRRQP